MRVVACSAVQARCCSRRKKYTKKKNISTKRVLISKAHKKHCNSLVHWLLVGSVSFLSGGGLVLFGGGEREFFSELTEFHSFRYCFKM